jgi:hypothetical protein
MPSLPATPSESRSMHLTRYAANSAMATHHHDLPSLSIVASGLYAWAQLLAAKGYAVLFVNP